MKIFILPIIMGCILLSWMIFIAIFFHKRIIAMLDKEDFVVNVKCEKCGNTYDVGISEYIRKKSSKKISNTKTERKGIALVSIENVTYIAKKFLCPMCNKKHWAQVLNFKELNERYQRRILSNSIMMMLTMAAGCAVIMGIYGIIFKIVKAL